MILQLSKILDHGVFVESLWGLVRRDQRLEFSDLLVEHLKQLLRFFNFHCFLFKLLLGVLKLWFNCVQLVIFSRNLSFNHWLLRLESDCGLKLELARELTGLILFALALFEDGSALMANTVLILSAIEWLAVGVTVGVNRHLVLILISQFDSRLKLQCLQNSAKYESANFLPILADLPSLLSFTETAAANKWFLRDFGPNCFSGHDYAW